MQLLEAMRIKPKSRIALVGSGGKTTAMFQLARQIEGGAIVTTTTHISYQQASLADRHMILTDIHQLDELQDNYQDEVVCITGPLSDPDRVTGPGKDGLSGLVDMAEKLGRPILIEADGSRMRPLKAPASHEPVIPDWIDQVVVCVGLSGLGKPLTEQWIHRPAIYAQLSGLSEGNLITEETIINVCLHPQGGLKGIPEGAWKTILLNQADTVVEQVAGSRIAKSLLGAGFNSGLVASLGLDPKESWLDVQSPFDGPVYAVHEKITGIILAAGESRRMGKPKQLLEWQGRPFVWWVAHMALTAGLDPVIVVTGAESESVWKALQDLPVQRADNPDWHEGQSSSLKKGLGSLSRRVGGAIFLLVDQPQVTEPLLRRLVEEHERNRSPIIAPQVEDRRANPVLFDLDTFPALMELKGDIGGRGIFSQFPIRYFPWYDSRLLLDVDSLEDYRLLLEGEA